MKPISPLSHPPPPSSYHCDHRHDEQEHKFTNWEPKHALGAIFKHMIITAVIAFHFCFWNYEISAAKSF